MTTMIPDARSPQIPSSSHVRWIVLALLFWVSMSNFLDRSVFGNLAPEMPQYLHLADKVKSADVDLYWKDHSGEVLAAVRTSPHQAQSDSKNWQQCQAYIKAQIAKSSWGESYWNINMFFTAAYAISMLLMGRLTDVWGLRWGFSFAILIWMLAETMHALAPEIGGLFGSAVVGFYICRALLGLGEGGVSPAVIKGIAEWFPKKDRALATGIASGASSIGAVLVPWLMPFLLMQFSAMTIGGVILGWRGLFILTGAVDILLVTIWIISYRDPENQARVSAAELAYIHSDSVDESTVRVPWLKLLRHRQTWAFICAKSLTDGFWWFYLFGSPDFFNRRFNLDPAGRQYMLVIIYLVSAVGAVAGGWLAGRFMNNGWTANRARKATMLICALLTAPVFFSAVTGNRWIAAVLITLAASGHQAWGANVHCLPGDMFPRRTVGSLVGIAGACSTGTSLLLMYAIGQIVKSTGTYVPIFFMASVAYMLALFLTHLLAPHLEPVDIDEAQPNLPIEVGVAAAGDGNRYIASLSSWRSRNTASSRRRGQHEYRGDLLEGQLTKFAPGDE
jgi:ACS family hexuronate transporter-like MFS transporter